MRSYLLKSLDMVFKSKLVIFFMDVSWYLSHLNYFLFPPSVHYIYPHMKLQSGSHGEFPRTTNVSSSKMTLRFLNMSLNTGLASFQRSSSRRLRQSPRNRFPRMNLHLKWSLNWTCECGSAAWFQDLSSLVWYSMLENNSRSQQILRLSPGSFFSWHWHDFMCDESTPSSLVVFAVSLSPADVL